MVQYSLEKEAQKGRGFISSRPSGAQRVTLQDIAQRTGFTVNTVSRALKNKSDISAATCQYIQGVAHEMGYIRNQMASALRSGHTRTLGVIVSGMSNPYYGVMTDAIQDEAARHGYSPLILCSRDDPDLELQAAESAMSRQVDGMLLFPCNGSRRTIERMKAVGMPFVLMARRFHTGEEDSVVCDEEAGAYLATRHLIEAGRRRLAYLSSHDIVFSSEQREHGFLRACAEGGIAPKDVHQALCRGNDSIQSQLRLWRSQGVDGLFAFCDMEAWNVISLLQKDGLRVPRDLALTGFDNIQGLLPLPSPLCTVDYSLPEMVRSGMELLRRRIHGEALPPQTIVFQPRIVCRGSCGCIPETNASGGKTE